MARGRKAKKVTKTVNVKANKVTEEQAKKAVLAAIKVLREVRDKQTLKKQKKLEVQFEKKTKRQMKVIPKNIVWQAKEYLEYARDYLEMVFLELEAFEQLL